MIDPSTLKLNNIIKVKMDGHWRTSLVYAILRTFVIAKNHYNGANGSFDFDTEIHGAKISEAWLENFGWDKDANGILSLHKARRFSIIHGQDGFELRKNGKTVGPAFTFLHELQNQYKEASGEELYDMSRIKTILSVG